MNFIRKLKIQNLEEIILVVNRNFRNQLNNLTTNTLSRADIIRLSVVLYSYSIDQIKSGKKLGVIEEDENGNMTVEKIIVLDEI